MYTVRLSDSDRVAEIQAKLDACDQQIDNTYCGAKLPADTSYFMPDRWQDKFLGYGIKFALRYEPAIGGTYIDFEPNFDDVDQLSGELDFLPAEMSSQATEYFETVIEVIETWAKELMQIAGIEPQKELRHIFADGESEGYEDAWLVDAIGHIPAK